MRVLRTQRFEHTFNEHRFAVKNINLRVGHLTVYQQGQTQVLHSFQRPCAMCQIGDPCIGVGGRTCGVELDCLNPTIIDRILNVLRAGVIGQV